MRDFRELQVWHKAHHLTLYAYEITAQFPRREMFGLISQIRRCSASIAANLAEGCGRSGDGELHRFLQIAAGSGSELEYHFMLARDLEYLNDAQYRKAHAMTVEVRKMLTAFIERVSRDRRSDKNGRIEAQGAHC